jgi:hypothetical protein
LEQALAILDDLHHPDAADVRAKLRRPRPGREQAVALASPRRDGP